MIKWIILGIILLVIVAYGYKLYRGIKLYYFYDTDCQFCQKFEPTWNDIQGDTMTSMINPSKFNMSTPAGKNKAAPYNIKKVPAIVKVTDAGHEKYDGEMAAADILLWAKKPIVITSLIQKTTEPKTDD